MSAIVVTLLSPNTWSNGIDMTLPNPLRNLHQISQIALRFFLQFKNAEGCVWPMEGGDVRFCWCDCLGLITLFVLCLVILRVKALFLYILYIMSFAIHFVLGHLDVYMQSYGHLKLNGSVYYVARIALHLVFVMQHM